MVVPGFASTETLLYSPELKFYSNKVKMDASLRTNISGLHCLGDSSRMDERANDGQHYGGSDGTHPVGKRKRIKEDAGNPAFFFICL